MVVKNCSILLLALLLAAGAQAKHEITIAFGHSTTVLCTGGEDATCCVAGNWVHMVNNGVMTIGGDACPNDNIAVADGELDDCKSKGGCIITCTEGCDIRSGESPGAQAKHEITIAYGNSTTVLCTGGKDATCCVAGNWVHMVNNGVMTIGGDACPNDSIAVADGELDDCDSKGGCIITCTEGCDIRSGESPAEEVTAAA